MNASMFVLPAILLGSKQLGIDYENPDHIFFLRLGYAVTHSAILIITALIYTIVLAKNEVEEKVKVKEEKKPFQTEEPAEVEVTVKDHDFAEMKKVLQKVLMGGLITGLIHYKWEFMQPLLIQSVMNGMQFFGGKLFQVHILNFAPVDALKRPWVEEKPAFAKMMEDMQQQNQNAALPKPDKKKTNKKD
eukprot:GFYU01000379.1.p1 GENE.GFYU01000379.1~~GFYU01000379.1.p1  ORF type:complete len:197 (+),score=74.68 GFYU01000379.1:25-591(+)